MEEILLGFLGKTLNMPPEQIAELLYTKEGEEQKARPDALENLLELDRNRVGRLKSESNEKIAQDQYKRGVKEGKTEFEKTLREKYGFEGDLTGADLFDAIVQQQVKTASKVSPDDIKKHPVFLQLEGDLKSQIKKITEQYEQEKEAIQKEYGRKALLGDVTKSALSHLDALNPVFPANKNIASNLRELFLREFDQYDYQPTENGFLVVKDGKRIEDAHGNPVGFTSLVGDIAGRYFEFKKQEPTGNAGNKNGDGQGAPKHTNVKVPTNEAEYQEAVLNARSYEERAALREAWQQQGGGGEA